MTKIRLRRKLLIMLLLIGILSIFPVVYASTYNISVSDAFNLHESLSTLLGIVQKVSDSFHFTEAQIIIATFPPQVLSDKFHLQEGAALVTVGQPNVNPFVNQTRSNGLVFIDTTSVLGTAITEFAVPIFFLMAVLVVAWKIGVMGIYIMLPILMFTLAGIGWILSGNWTTVIVMEIIFAASSLTMVMLKFLGMRGAGEESSV